MKLSEVIDLFEAIKRYYTNFTTEKEKRETWHELLRDIPLDVAMDNLKRHASVEKFPPTIADIRGKMGQLIEQDQSKAETESYFAQLDLWRTTGSPPPDGYWQRVRQNITGENA